MSSHEEHNEDPDREGSYSNYQEELQKKESQQSSQSGSQKLYTFDPMAHSKDSPPESLGQASKKALSNDFQMNVDEDVELMESSMLAHSGRKSSLMISVDDSVRFPSVYLEHSPKGQRSLKVKIPMYKTTTFMKIQTQIFVLDVTDPNSPQREFQIERRYSQFIELYEALFYNQPGFILCPFPDKNFASFFKIKLGIGLHQTTEKVELIQRRMFELEKFINHITHHQLLRNSQEINIFLQEDREKFQEGMRRMERYAEENKNMEQPSQVKNWVGKGRNLWATYIRKQNKPEKRQSIKHGLHGIKFTQIEEAIQSLKGKLLRVTQSINQLHSAEKVFSEFTDFKTENDVILKLCAKHSSSRDFCRKFSNQIEIKILDELQFRLRTLEEADKVVKYRQRIADAYAEAPEESEGERKRKIGRRMEILQTNFLQEWETFQQQAKRCSELTLDKFKEYWAAHKSNMRKVWRHKN